jgi:hypothetical protein
MRDILKTLSHASTERYTEASTKHTFEVSLKHFIRCQSIAIDIQNRFSLLLKAGWFLLVEHLEVPVRPYFEGYIGESKKGNMVFNIYHSFFIKRKGDF